MRRSSLIGPLVLIAIGLVFLLRNLLPEFRLTEILAIYWPWLLIGWGGLRTIEILNWHRQGQLTPRGGMGGGEWVLVIVIVIFGSGLYATRNAKFFRLNGIHLPHWEILGERFDYPLSASLPATGKTPRIFIDNPRGDARVIGIDTEEVRVTGTKSIRAITRDDANQQDKATGFELVRSGDQIIIRTNLDRANDSRQANADLEITVPKGAAVESRGRYGDFDIENIDGAVEVNSDNAGVRLNNIGGEVRVNLRRSDIVRVVNARSGVEIKGRGQDVELENIAGPTVINGQYSGDMKFRNLAKPFRFESQASNVRIERIEGEVELLDGRLAARRITGPVRITSRNKDVEISDFTDTLEVELERGDIQLRPGRLPLAKINARTRSGNAELVLPTGAKLDLKAEVKRGQIENNYSDAFKVVEDGRAASIAGSTGGPEVRFEVDRGEFHIRKANAPDASPAPAPPPAPKAPAQPASLAPLEVTRQ
jgi:hypothetical protein